MAHAQNTPRGLLVKAAQITVGAQNITANSTALLISGGVRVSGVQTISANSSAHVIMTTIAAKPSSLDAGAAWALISNSTGVAIAINSTGTTWKYFNLTSVQPT